RSPVLLLSPCPSPLRRRGVRLLPVLVRIEDRDRRGLLCRIRPEILLVDVAVLADDEAHHAGLAVLHRPGDDSEAADHAVVHQVAVSAARCVGALAIEQAIAIAVIALA